MAAGSKRGGDMVLGGRHLVGIFFLLVVVLGLVFTLGYLLGRSQYDTQLRAAANIISPPAAHAASNVPARAPASAAAKDSSETVDSPRAKNKDKNKDQDGGIPVMPVTSDWDFYHSADPAKPPAKLEKLSSRPSRQADAVPDANKPAAAANPPAPPAKTQARAISTTSGKPVSAPLIPRGSTVLQVAALAHESDALAMAQALQQKKFPAFVLSPEGDNFYRVQVGPYGDARAANAARQRLEDQGFKSIIKR